MISVHTDEFHKHVGVRVAEVMNKFRTCEPAPRTVLSGRLLDDIVILNALLVTVDSGRERVNNSTMPYTNEHRLFLLLSSTLIMSCNNETCKKICLISILKTL